MQAEVRLRVAEGVHSLVADLVGALGTAAVLFVGVHSVQSGELTLGQLLLIIAYLSQLYGPMTTLSKKVVNVQSALTGAQRVFELLDEPPHVEERPDARPLIRARGAIEFSSVSFGYDDDTLVLHNIDFSVPAGARLGIAGRTGAGKTTLVSLLMRFYDPTSGAIRLDGHDLRDYSVRDLRNQFALVLQEPVLFSGTIAENIGYGRLDACFADIEQAAAAANAHDFITRLPNGYDTLVGERGMRLSGGERQRISLARAFLRDAPILILDEPTSSVDVKTELAIMDSMQRLMNNRTTFMIAHRLSTLDHCDLIMEIEHGEIVTTTVALTTAERPSSDDAGALQANAPVTDSLAHDVDAT
jgi:ATP-binding cassette subfamily B protein